ncbi:MAG: hypothetical protein H0Z28_02420 [Archaeoglobus sp.]|nr:hypothetical protein [Archaeoglobus sp.]
MRKIVKVALIGLVIGSIPSTFFIIADSLDINGSIKKYHYSYEDFTDSILGIFEGKRNSELPVLSRSPFDSIMFGLFWGVVGALIGMLVGIILSRKCKDVSQKNNDFENSGLKNQMDK